MTKVNKSVGTVVCRIVCMSIMVAALAVSALITVYGGHSPLVPTWDALFINAGFQQPSLPVDQLRVTILDVGNGDCILIENGGDAVLIDTGGHSRSQHVLTVLREHGVQRLKAILVTHTDIDHIGAMDEILDAYDVEAVWKPLVDPEKCPKNRIYTDMMSAIRQHNIPVQYPAFGKTCDIGNAKLTVISGLNPVPYGDSNDDSVVSQLTFGDHTLLFMADVGSRVENRLLHTLESLQADVIKVAHHGSSTSSSEAFINAVDPRYAVITCGLGNLSKHPHEETLEILNKVGATTYRSDLHGDIVFVSDGTTLLVETQR